MAELFQYVEFKYMSLSSSRQSFLYHYPVNNISGKAAKHPKNSFIIYSGYLSLVDISLELGPASITTQYYQRIRAAEIDIQENIIESRPSPKTFDETSKKFNYTL